MTFFIHNKKLIGLQGSRRTKNKKGETENCRLIDSVMGVEAENHRLNLENDALKKSLEKQKNLYRNFSNDVVEFAVQHSSWKKSHCLKKIKH